MATGGARGARIKPNDQTAPGPIGNTTGLIVPQTAPNPHGNSAPPIKPTPKEESWWSKWGDVVHTALDVVGMIPVVGEVADGANALIYLAEGDAVNAALSAASMLPVGGQAATAAKWGKKGIEAAEAAAKAGKTGKTAAKVEKEAAEQAAKKEAKEEVAQQASKNGGNKGGKDHGRGGPCDHLKKGNSNGEGPFRGGSYGGTKQSGIESHHAPANSTSPLPKSQGPALQMEPGDHRMTSSHGHQGADGAAYRAELAQLIAEGRWRDAMAKEVRDIRAIAREQGDPRKYNEAIKEMLEYFKCLEKHNGLPMPR